MGSSTSERRGGGHDGLHRLMLAAGVPLAVAGIVAGLRFGLLPSNTDGAGRPAAEQTAMHGLLPRLGEPDARRFDPSTDLARRADEALIRGALTEAADLYRQGSRRDPDDHYSRFVLACLEAERGEMSEARRLSRPLAEEDLTIGQVQHLQLLLERADSSPPSLGDYQATLEELLGDRRAKLDFQTLGRILGRRLYAWPEETVPPLQPVSDWRALVVRLFAPPAIRRLERPPLASIDLSGAAGEILGRIAYVSLALDDKAAVQEDVLEALERWRELEPDNALPDYLLAHAIDRWSLEMRASRSGEGYEALLEDPLLDEEPLPEPALQALLTGAGKTAFETHARELWEVAATTLRQRGDLFASLHLASPDRMLMGSDARQAVRLVTRMRGTPPPTTLSWIPVSLDLIEKLEEHAVSSLTRRVLASLVSLQAHDTSDLSPPLQELLRETARPSASERLARVLARRGFRGALQVPLPLPSLAPAWARAWLFEEQSLTKRFLSILDQ